MINQNNVGKKSKEISILILILMLVTVIIIVVVGTPSFQLPSNFSKPDNLEMNLLDSLKKIWKAYHQYGNFKRAYPHIKTIVTLRYNSRWGE